MNSPLGVLTLSATHDALIGLTIGSRVDPVEEEKPDHPLLALAVTQLREYFGGSRSDFDLPVIVAGTPFQEKIWSALQKIPYGQSMGYQELGLAAGVGKAPRAVGGAVGANPVPLIIPCHRVLASNKRITGYSGGEGIPTKVALLDLEGVSYN